jgi:hypothetical protein
MRGKMLVMTSALAVCALALGAVALAGTSSISGRTMLTYGATSSGGFVLVLGFLSVFMRRHRALAQGLRSFGRYTFDNIVCGIGRGVPLQYSIHVVDGSGRNRVAVATAVNG